ncbi:putative 2-dehydropantoate 2-reductase [Malonomonas rubra]|nr:putative 2-dehydropantoate 2-reductase [Malonomonas rubra]
MRIGIVGSGALGLYYGGMLQRSGQGVNFLLRRDLHAIQQNGLHVHSVNGDFYLPQVAGFANANEIGPVDLVIVGLKTFANDHLINLVRPLVGEQTAILTLQNGLGNEELLAAEFGGENILGGVAFLCSNRGESGHVHHLGEGKIRLGEFSGGLSERSKILQAMFETAGVPCEAVADLRRARWEKLVWNIPFNGLCALLRQDTDQVLALPEGRELAHRIMQEVVTGGNAQQLQQPIDGREFIERMIYLTDQMGGYKPSMMIDRLENRPLELEAIYAIPLQQAAAAGINMPRTQMLYTLLKAGESPI